MIALESHRKMEIGGLRRLGLLQNNESEIMGSFHGFLKLYFSSQKLNLSICTIIVFSVCENHRIWTVNLNHSS